MEQNGLILDHNKICENIWHIMINFKSAERFIATGCIRENWFTIQL